MARNVLYNQANLGTDIGQVLTAPIVSIKQKWADAWTVRSDLHCRKAIFATSPAIGQAELSIRYGKGMRHGDPVGNWIQEELSSVHRWYVKIEIAPLDPFDPNDNGMTWHGTLEINNNQRQGVMIGQTVGGVDQTVPRGQQTWVCYGLEKMLDDLPILQSIFSSVANEKSSIRGFTFNLDGKPNRTAAKGAGSIFLFEGDRSATSEYWSTRNIVDYLVGLVNDGLDEQSFAPLLRLENRDMLPDFDRPTIAAHGRSVYEILSRVISRQRMLGFQVFLSPGAPDELVISPFSLADQIINLPDGNILLNNTSLITLDFDKSPSSMSVIRTNSLDQFDQIRFQGARKRSCFTVSLTDLNLEIGWPPALAAEYDAGASGDAGYPAAGDIDQRQKRNREVRSTDRFEPVYSRFVIPNSWGGKAGDGLGGAQDFVTIRDNDPSQLAEVPINRTEMYILSTIPLLDGKDYSDDNIANGTVADVSDGPHQELSPIVLFKLPEAATRYQQAERMGELADLDEDDPTTNHRWSASVRVKPKDFGLYVKVSGGEQHVIAKTDFNPLPDDEAVGDVDYEDMLVTLAIETDEFVEGRFSASVGAEDLTKILRVDVGDNFRQDFIAYNTVVGVHQETGKLVTCTTAAFVRNDQPALQILAEQAYQWYNTTRTAIDFQTSAVSGKMLLSEMIARIGGVVYPVGSHIKTINAVITQITIDWPQGSGDDLPLPSQSYRTDYGELDILQFVPQRGV